MGKKEWSKVELEHRERGLARPGEGGVAGSEDGQGLRARDDRRLGDKLEGQSHRREVGAGEGLGGSMEGVRVRGGGEGDRRDEDDGGGNEEDE